MFMGRVPQIIAAEPAYSLRVAFGCKNGACFSFSGSRLKPPWHGHFAHFAHASRTGKKPGPRYSRPAIRYFANFNCVNSRTRPEIAGSTGRRSMLLAP